MHCTRDHLEEVIAKLEKKLVLRTGRTNVLICYNLSLTSVFFACLKLMVVLPKRQVTPRRNWRGLYQWKILCKLSHFVGRLKPTLGIAAK